MENFLTGMFLATLILAIYTTRLFRLYLWYSINSLVLGFLAIYIGKNLQDNPMIISGGITILLKSILIPYFLRFITLKFNLKRDISPELKIQFSILFIPLIIVFTFYLTTPILNSNYLAIGISAMFLSLLLIINHNLIAPKIVGFLMIENALFFIAVMITKGMPLFVELGIFFDLLMAIVIVNLLFKDIKNV